MCRVFFSASPEGLTNRARSLAVAAEGHNWGEPLPVCKAKP
ncbi:MAG: hypothetical protein ACJ8HU_10150 [Chthoniobacterales bacterium]